MIKKLFWGFLVFTVMTLLALVAIDTHLKTPASPAGILSFEMCAYDSSCAAIIEGWGPQARLMAALSLGVDYLFMVAYPGAICFGLLLVASYTTAGIRAVTVVMAWSVWVSGAADAFENYCLVQMLVEPKSLAYAWPATLAATVKFALVGATLGWLLVVWGIFVLPGAKIRRNP